MSEDITDLLVFLKHEARHTRSCLDTLLRRLDVIETRLSHIHPDDTPLSDMPWFAELEISTRLYNALTTNVRSLEHFKQLVESGAFAGLPNVGKVTVAEAKQVLGLRDRKAPPPVTPAFHPR